MERFERTPLICAQRRAVSQRNDRSSSSSIMGFATKATPKDLQETLEKHYYGCRFVTVESVEDVDNIDLLMPEELNDTNELRLYVFGNEERGQAILVGLLDNLVKALQDKRFRI